MPSLMSVMRARCRPTLRQLASIVLCSVGLSMFFPAASASEASRLDGIRTIGVVPRLGDVLHIEETGFTVFDRLNDTVNIRDWHIAEAIQADITANLRGRFELVSPALAALPDCTDAESCAVSLTHTSLADAYVVAFPATSTGLSQRDEWSGIGVFHVPGPFSRFKSIVHVMYRLALLDGKTRQVIRSVEGRLPDTVFGGEHAKPIKELDASTWPGDASHLTGAQREALRAAVTDLLHQSIPYTIDQLFATH